MVAIGELDQLISFDALTIVDDGYGGGSKSWVQRVQAWAKVAPVRASEEDRQGAQRGMVQYKIDCWQDGLSAVTEGDRIRWGSIELNIREIRLPPSRTMMMTIIAETGVTL